MHNGAIESELTGNGWVAVCDCGWSGVEREVEAMATEDLTRHYKESK